MISIKINDVQKLNTLLLDGNLNLEAMDENGNTPLLLAAFYGHDHCVEALLNTGAANYKHINFLGESRIGTIYIYDLFTYCGFVFRSKRCHIGYVRWQQAVYTIVVEQMVLHGLHRKLSGSTNMRSSNARTSTPHKVFL